MFEYIVVGAGLAGSVVAENIAKTLNKQVLVVEKRNHIGGNVYDFYDDNNILVHKYGPHIFHTNLKNVWDYLSQFTEWALYQHQVIGLLDGMRVPIPFNLNSIYQVFPRTLAERLEQKLISIFGYNVKIPILKLKETEDEDLRFLSKYIYEKVFLNYTVKQWGCKPEELDPSVVARVPVYVSRDNRYFQDKYQAIPQKGYTALVNNILSDPRIKIMLNTDFREIIQLDFERKEISLFGQKYSGTIIYTGMLDELMDYMYGELPYRSLNIKFASFEQSYYQEVGTVNYPNNYDFTRITEFKRLTGQISGKTTILQEYPERYDRFSENSNNIPYYPIPCEENARLYKRYQEEVRQFKTILYTGRLADYSYYDMDIVVAKALDLFEQLRGETDEQSGCGNSNL